MSSVDALTALGSDMAFSVSYTISAEMRLAALSAGIAEHELIAIVLVLAIFLSALPSTLLRAQVLAQMNWDLIRGRLDRLAPRLVWAIEWLYGSETDTDPAAGRLVVRTRTTLLQFAQLLVDITRRITFSLLVQLVASTAISHQTMRITRILSLFSVAVFFLFLQSGASAVERPNAVAHKHT